MLEILVAANDMSFQFSLADLFWRGGPPLPADLNNIVSVQLGDGFMVLGGRDEEGYSVDNIYPIDYEQIWFSYLKTLDEPKFNSIGVEVPSDFCNC